MKGEKKSLQVYTKFFYRASDVETPQKAAAAAAVLVPAANSSSQMSYA